MTWLYVFVAGALTWLLTQFTTWGHNLALWIWDQLLSVVDFAVGLVPAGTLTSLPGFSGLPADLLGIFGAMGGWQALGIIGSALIIRIPLSYILRG